MLLGGADVAVGGGEREAIVVREPLFQHRAVLLQEETRNLLVLGETHPELLRHPRRHLEVWGGESGDLEEEKEEELPGFGVRVWGLDVGKSLESWTVEWTPAGIVAAPPCRLRRG